MQINKKFRLHEVTSTERPKTTSLTNILFLKHHAVATNGYCLAIVPAEAKKNVLVTKESVKFATKNKKPHIAKLETDGNIVQANNGKEIQLFELPEQNYPDWLSIYKRTRRIKRRSLTVKLNASLLKNLADALGNEKIVLHFDKEIFEKQSEQGQCYNYLVYVETEDASGIFMPMGY